MCAGREAGIVSETFLRLVLRFVIDLTDTVMKKVDRPAGTAIHANRRAIASKLIYDYN
jgi:hypothetical protein